MMTKLLRSSSLVLLLLLSLSRSAHSLSPGKVLPTKARSAKRLSWTWRASAIRPSLLTARQIVFTRSWVDKVKDERVSNLWIVDSDGSRTRELHQRNLAR